MIHGPAEIDGIIPPGQERQGGMPMDKMRFETRDIVAGNIDKIAELFPAAVTEMRGEDGRVRKGIRFEVLRQLLSRDAADGDECYEFTWVGKRAAMAEAARPTTRTLRPVREDSRDWDTTRNLYIEGDNLEVLKILQESYLGKIQVIYIDPPYNTGNDFIYPDAFAMDSDAYNGGSGYFDENGNINYRRTNTASAGRYHSDWCSMLYARLILARNLLRPDGIIFISIDDNESENLKKICDEVFGESNYLNTFAWISNVTGRQISGKGAAKTWESVLAYAKDIGACGSLSVDVRFAKEKMPDAYKGFDRDIRTDGIGPFAVGDTLYNHNRKFNEETRPNLVFSVFYDPETERISTGEIGEHRPGWVELPPHPNGDGVHKYHAWRWSRQKIEREAHELIVLPTASGGYEIYTRIRDFDRTLLKDVITNISNGDAEVRKLFGGRKYFDYPKSVDLIRTFIAAAGDSSAICLDFFSGSATTAHAVMQLNAEDGGQRKFIMVQLPEPCGERTEAFRAGYRNICEIARERIRRAGDKIRADAAPDARDLDVGFRVFRVDSSNMKDVYYRPEELTQQSVFDLVSNIKEDRTDLDLLYACLLDWGMELHLPHTCADVDGCTVHDVDNGALMACFSSDIPVSVVEHMARRRPRRAVFRDSAFTSDDRKINVTEIFRNFSPETKIKVI